MPTARTLRAQQGDGPFELADEPAYRAWRATKLERYPTAIEQLVVQIEDPFSISASERDAIRERCGRANMAVYAFPPLLDETAQRRAVLQLGRFMGLEAVEDHRSRDQDGLVAIEVVESGGRLGYIPYTSRPIAWHTDGYYNYHGPDRAVQAMLLHCVRDADGGDNRLLDHEIAYIRLRDENPAYIAALMHPEAMAIPANVEPDGKAVAGDLVKLTLHDDGAEVRLNDERWRVAGKTTDAKAGKHEFVLTRAGKDNDQPAELRRVLTATRETLTIRTEAKAAKAVAAVVRNEYVLNKK